MNCQKRLHAHLDIVVSIEVSNKNKHVLGNTEVG